MQHKLYVKHAHACVEFITFKGVFEMSTIACIGGACQVRISADVTKLTPITR